MNRTSLSFLGSIAILSVGISACDKDDEIVCPPCDAPLSWDTSSKSHSALGELSLEGGQDDSYARQMLDKCPGWSIHDGHNGGIGDTLEIASCDNGIVLTWAYNRFFSIALSSGWAGKTSSGVVNGSGYLDFIQAYPGYQASSTQLTSWGFAALDYDGGHAYFEDSVLARLIVY
ncbi:MAG: hypothetical protein WC551_05920 [Patescibacteria group bacterium]